MSTIPEAPCMIDPIDATTESVPDTGAVSVCEGTDIASRYVVVGAALLCVV
jgi:hypothetical protein